MFYAQSTGGFYLPDQIKPADAVEISDNTHDQMLSAINSGGSIMLRDGEPVIVEHVATLADKKAARIVALTEFCAAAVMGGYTSDALGSAHTYPSKTTDQINMMGSVSASLLPGIAADWSTPFWCQDESGVWAFRMHSAAQIQTAGADGKAHVVLCQSTLEQLTSTVMAAKTAEAVDAVVWPSA